MKNLLLATTALVLTAGVAAAEVAVSGDGRMGVVYDGDEMNFESRARVKFTLSGETDGGLGFGASFRSHEAVDAEAGLEGSIYVSGAFGKVEMGDTVGASEALLGDLPEVGFTDIGNNDIPYLTGDQNDTFYAVANGEGAITAADNPSLLYTYTTGALSLAASFTDGYNDDRISTDDQEYALAASYNFGSYAVGLGYEVADADGVGKAKMLGLGGTANFGDTAVKAFYGEGDDLIDGVKVYGLGVESAFGATTVAAFWQTQDFDSVGLDKIAYYGIGASYDLGGGASVVGGVADSDEDGSDAVYDLGLQFNF
jgi:outer membrane protein OmpU